MSEVEHVIPTKEFISYTMYGEMMDELVDVLMPKRHEYASIHGLPRGGLAIAVHLSHYLQLPFTLNVTQFTNEYPDGKLLVVDDIIDTGVTFERFLDIASLKKINFETAVLYYKSHSSYTPTLYLRETNNWICFPWEMIEEKPNREKYVHLGGDIDPVNTGLDINTI